MTVFDLIVLEVQSVSMGISDEGNQVLALVAALMIIGGGILLAVYYGALRNSPICTGVIFTTPVYECRSILGISSKFGTVWCCSFPCSDVQLFCKQVSVYSHDEVFYIGVSMFAIAIVILLVQLVFLVIKLVCWCRHCSLADIRSGMKGTNNSGHGELEPDL